MGDVKRVDLDARRVELGHGSSLAYDYLVVALGARTGYFGHDEWVRHEPGLPAWLLWMSVHLVFLMGMRNRIGVFLSWIWSYCRRQRGARIIVDTREPLPEELVKR